jgi:chromate reductase
MTDRPLKILAISGSLRKGSYNTSLLRLAAASAPANMTVTIFDRLGEMPLLNTDLIQASGLPAVVTEFGAAVKAADGLLIAVAEYNFSVSPALKNAVDWLSRLPPPVPLVGKPVAMMGAAMGPVGTARAQYDLRKILNSLDTVIMNKPEVFVSLAHTKFNAEGQLTDETAKGLVKTLMENFGKWIAKHG